MKKQLLELNADLERLAVITTEVKLLKEEYNTTFKRVFNIILNQAKLVKEHKDYKESKRRVIALKVRLDCNILIKEDIVSLTINYYEAGISLDLEDTKLTKAFIKNVIKYIKAGKLSKAKVNKLSNDDIKKLIGGFKAEEMRAKYIINK